MLEVAVLIPAYNECLTIRKVFSDFSKKINKMIKFLYIIIIQLIIYLKY